MKLVVVESPSKAKTIEKYLGKGYKVKASKGHVVDLPKSELGVDVDKNFEPKYVVTKAKALADLKKAFKDADELILAVDLDREGEAIGWHIARELKLINEKGDIVSRKKGMQRIVFAEITKEAIQAAIKNPREIDMNLVDAQQARRVLDRIVGYKLSPLLWKKIRYGLSAGRVQSVALRLIVDREDERNKFDPEEYWSLTAYLSDEAKSGKFKHLVKKSEDEQLEVDEKLWGFDLVKIDGKKAALKNEKQAEAIVSKLYQADWEIGSLESKEVKRTPNPPFTTSTMQQAAANRLGFSAKQTMSVAQKLYEAGVITYMRTDSLNLAKSAIDQARKYIEKEVGKNYLPEKPKYYTTKSKSSQEAHEAIRPTDMTKTPEKMSKLEGAQAKLYDLIWRRAVASQMKSAVLEQSKVVIEIDNLTFQMSGQRVLFPGFLKLYPQRVSENIIPELEEGQKLHAHEVHTRQHFTQPPPRYSEAKLIKALESFGIGRPSTYAPTIATIMARKYVEKIGQYFQPTDTGVVVTRLLVKHFPDVVDTDFTSEVEADLDKVAEGKEKWQEVIGDFYKPFMKQLEEKEEEIKRDDFTVLGKSDMKCPECGKKMIIKLGRYGRFLSCKDFPDCKGMRDMDGRTEADVAKEAKSKQFLDIYDEAPKTEDGRDYILKRGRYGKFWAHPDYPKVKDAQPLEYNKQIFKKIYGTPPKTKDGKKMILRRGKFGEFWAHPNYPDKKEVQKLNKKEVAAKKKELGVDIDQ